ncbi:hypothetical protein [Youngiibacter fragilis]|uniref:PepSY domain-containing protein n=1 Tax=Youngiibacter fragilis 232.1 TaxID=994573 RepID=V7I1J6_9CLOT|nr:hypothetical protein [Youngiibacter fragilis]ETA79146.1 hypothetical protein T472_0218245 [Youngiibacter fragilis 232.1]
MIRSLKYLAPVIAASFLFASCETRKPNPQDVYIFKVASFSELPDESISFVRNKTYDGRIVMEFTDDEYIYELDEAGRFLSIFVKDEPKKEDLNDVKSEVLQEKTTDYLLRLGVNPETYEITYAISSSKEQVTAVARHKSGEYFTGNNVYLQYIKDGTLISISMKYEDPAILNKQSTISMEQARKILFDYLETSELMKPYITQLSTDKISSEVDIYYGKKVYNFYFTLATANAGKFKCKYVISTETGSILSKLEPK